jgi:hypothetical protein
VTLVFITGAVAALAIGWVAGMLTFRRSALWCRQCGEILGCLRCEARLAPVGTDGGRRLLPANRSR